MILKWDDGAIGVPPMCFSMPVSQPSILSWHVVEARVGEHDLEDDGRHAPADVFSFRFLRLDSIGSISARTQLRRARDTSYYRIPKAVYTTCRCIKTLASTKAQQSRLLEKRHGS